MKKICSRCLKIKDISKFSYRKDTKDNLYHYCRDCGNLMTANYRKKNRKKYLLSIKKRYKEYYYQYHKNYQIEHKEEIKIRSRLYYIKNKKRINQRGRDYNKTDKGKHIQRIKSYKQRVQRLNGSHTLDEWKNLKKKFNYKCAICKKRKKLTRDHIIPLSKNGSNYIENIQPLCQSCNSRKYNN